MNQCTEYGESRYKVKDNNGYDNDYDSKKSPSAKVLWHMPIIPRFKRLFNNMSDTKNIRWLINERKYDGKNFHVADSLQWKKSDSLFSDFDHELRNLRLGLDTDRIIPFDNLSTNHTSWPILLTIYKLYPWLCMVLKYVLLFMMILGPKQPGNEIDFYISPLIEDLRVLWE